MSFRNWVYLAISLAGQVVLLWVIYRVGFDSARFPQREDLISAETQVLRVTPDSYGASIWVDAPVRRLTYSWKSGELDQVLGVLGAKEEQPLTLCYRPQRLNPSSRAPAPVIFEIRASREMIRSLAEVRQSWREDDKWLFVLIPMLLLASTYLAFRAGK